MHSTQLHDARLAAHRGHERVEAIVAALPRVSTSAETALAYVAVSAFWGLVLYLVLMAIGS